MPVPISMEDWTAMMDGPDVMPLEPYATQNPWNEKVWGSNSTDFVNSEAGRWAQIPREQLAMMRPPPPPMMPPSTYLSRVPITIEDCFGRLQVGRRFVSGAAQILPMAQGGTEASLRYSSAAKNPLG